MDGNGRLGRLLITFILCVDGVLQQPLVYLILVFKTYRSEYYQQLQLARKTGDFEKWLAFFLEGTISTANQAVLTVQNVQFLIERDRDVICSHTRNTSSLLTVYERLLKKPISDAKSLSAGDKLSLPTINTALQKLINMNIVKEITGKDRNKIYSHWRYLDILSEGLMHSRL